MIDTSKFHPDLKNYRFRAVNTMDINTGKIVGWRILLKERGRGHKWRYAGNGDGPYLFDSEVEARAAAKECNEWANA